MKNIILILLFPFLVSAQETKKIEDYENKETYYVLKSNKKIKHGEYKRYSFNDKLIAEGQYNQGKKDGVWTYYNFQREETLQYDYSNAMLISYKPLTNFKIDYSVIKNGKLSEEKLARTPIFLEGDFYLISGINRSLSYPREARESDVMGTVNVSFIVDKFGKASNFHVKKPLGYGLDEEAIRVLKDVKGDWLPGLLNNEQVDVEVTYPVTFKFYKYTNTKTVTNR